LHFCGRGLAVAGRLAGRVGPAFQNVRDVNIAALQAHGLDNFREQLPGSAHERLALPVFVRARRFADEHELRVNVADAEHDVFARGCKVRAFDAGENALLQFGVSGGFGFGDERGAIRPPRYLGGYRGRRWRGLGLNGSRRNRGCGNRRRCGYRLDYRCRSIFYHARSLVERGEAFRRDGNETNALRFQILQLLDRGIKEFMIDIRHQKHRSAVSSKRTQILADPKSTVIERLKRIADVYAQPIGNRRYSRLAAWRYKPCGLLPTRAV
jgi:hypothetical protein